MAINNSSFMNSSVGGKWGQYELVKHLGAGSFGEVYQGLNANSGEHVAIKLEKRDNRHQQLLLEAKLYRILGGTLGIPKVHTYGIDGEYNVLVIELLGQSLESLFSQCGRKFSLKTVLMLCEQTITRVEYLHENNFLHRDIKPDNFLVGIGARSHVVYMIDLGLAKKYKSTSTQQHIPYREGKSLTGTARYASIATHLGWEQSRRDDMVAIGYMMLYFLCGALPWQGLNAQGREEKYKKIMESKMSTTLDELCEGASEDFVKYFRYLSTLDFEDRPDYDYCRQLFRDRFKKEGFEMDYQYDWLQTGSGSPRSKTYRSDKKSKHRYIRRSADH